ncbi:MAG: putative sugar nucleotidyl transferase [Bacteroidota bacterium]
MNVILFDRPQDRVALRPFSDTRPLSHTRLGITTLLEKWQVALPGTYSYLTAPYLRSKFPTVAADQNVCINSTLCPNPSLVDAIRSLKPHQQLVQGSTWLASVADRARLQVLLNEDALPEDRVDFQGSIRSIQNRWDIFLYNAELICQDWDQLCSSKVSPPVKDPYTRVYNPAHVFVEPSAAVKAATLNAEAGPIYIGADAIVHEGAILQGPVALCTGAQVYPGTYLHSATTVGPYAKVGGELSHVVIFGYSNKVHHGFLGHTVVGEWCNLGAGTTTATLKNDYSTIQVWDYLQQNLAMTSLQFCGACLGDYTKCSIHTMLNAGTVVGVSASLAGAGFHDPFVPSFTYAQPLRENKRYPLPQALEAADRTMQRRSRSLQASDHQILTYLFEQSSNDFKSI